MGILSNLELEYDIDDVEKFLQYFRKLCDDFEPLVIGLENVSKYQTNLNELERLIHNTAWGARLLNQSEVADFCVFCEEMINQAKRNLTPVKNEVIEWFLLLGEQFEKYCKSYESDASVLPMFNPLIINVPNFI